MSSTIGNGYPAAGGRSAWGGWVGIGSVVLLAGIIGFGNLLLATAVSVRFVGAMLIAGGIAQSIFALPVRGQWARVALWLVLGALYVIAGAVTFRNPVLATSPLTLLLAAMLIAAGLVRTVAGFGLRPVRGWGWVLASGALTLIIGFVIGAGWPVHSLWVLGLLLSIDLIFAGIAYIVFGIDIRPRSRRAHRAARSSVVTHGTETYGG